MKIINTELAMYNNKKNMLIMQLLKDNMIFVKLFTVLFFEIIYFISHLNEPQYINCKNSINFIIQNSIKKTLDGHKNLLMVFPCSLLKLFNIITCKTKLQTRYSKKHKQK